MSREKKPIPKFENEREEARWWYEHREELDDYMDPVPESESEIPLHIRLNLPPRPERRKPPTRQVPLRIPTDDLTRAQKLAERKGIGYQTLLKMIIHEGLEREEKRAQGF